MVAGKKNPEEKNTDTPGITRSLRDDAEEQLARSPKHSPKLKEKTPEQLIYELEVHQVELETQAEELRRAHIALGESRDKYLDLYEFAPTGYLTLNDKALITDVNLTGVMLLGVERKDLLKAPFSKFFARKDADQWHLHFVKVLKKGEHLTCNPILIRGDGSTFPARLEGVRLTSSGDGAMMVRIAFSDITDIRNAKEAERRQSANLSILNNIITTANKADDLPLLLDSILMASLHLLDFDAGGIYLVTPSTRIADVVHSKNLPPEFLADMQTIPIDLEPYRTIFIRHEPIITENYDTFAPGQSKISGFLSLASVPLLSKGVAVGALNIASKRRQVISDDEKLVLISIGRELGSTIERMVTEEEVKKVKKNLETVFASINEMVFVLDMKGRILTVNKAVLERLQYTRGELTGMDVLALHVPERRDEALGIVQGMIAGTTDSCPVPVIAKDGTRIEVETTVTHGWWNNQDVLIGVSRDVTERKQAEDALRESDERHRTILQTTNDGFWIIDLPEGNLTDVNETYCRMSGYTRDELLKLRIPDLDAIKTPDEQAATIRKIITNGSGIFETRHKRKDGSVFDIELSVTYQKTNGGKLICFCRDITDRKRAEEALHESARYTRNLIEVSPDPLVTISPEGKITDVNAATERVTGYSRNYLVGTDFSNYFTDLEKARQGYRKVFNDGVVQDYPLEIRHRDGPITSVLYNAAIYHDEAGTVQGVFAAARDITDRKRAEEALLQANKKLNLLSSITRHDINNQLTVLMGFLSILEMKQSDATLNEYFQKVSTAAERISAMIRFTKEYEEIGVHAPTWQDCRTLVDTAAKQAPLGKIMVKNDLPAGAEVFADPLVVKVFYNLMDNAVRYGGKITMIRFSALESGDDHVIVCEDDGEGVVAGEKEKIFGRGFGKNTGLGLALSREILDITGISIKETGKQGKGARFELVVPKGAWR